MLDLLIVLGFVVYAITSGMRSKAEAGKDLKQYFLAGKTLTGWKAGISMAATQFAADTPLLVTGLLATGGIFLLWRLWIYGLAFLLMGYLFSTKWRRAEVITDAELAELRYSGNAVTLLRVLKAFYYGTVINCTVMAMVLVAATRISEVFLIWDQWLPPGFYGSLYSVVESLGLQLSSSTGADPYIATTNNFISIGLILTFTTLYSTTGGLRSVVATDVVQFGFAMVGTLFYAGFVLFKIGGPSELVARLSDLYGQAQAAKFLSFSPGIEEGLGAFIVLIGMQWLFQMNSDGTGYLAQRMIACKTDRDARIAALVFSWAQIFFRSLIWLVIGLGLLVLYPIEEAARQTEGFVAGRELLFITGINDYLPMGIKGIMLTGLLGALASTIDTHLNWGSSYWANDIYGDLICRHWRKKESNPRELVWVARFSNLLILVVAMIIMFNLGSIQQAWKLSLLFGSGMGSVLILRWLWERINLWSEITAMAASLVFAPIILITIESNWQQIVAMAGLSTLSVIVVSLLTPRTDPEKLKSFHKRVKPQGFWKQTAIAVGGLPGIPLAKLKVSLKDTAIAGGSLFAMLVGTSKFFLRPPGEGPWPSLILIVIGLALIPLWWRTIANEEPTDTVSVLEESPK